MTIRVKRGLAASAASTLGLFAIAVPSVTHAMVAGGGNDTLCGIAVACGVFGAMTLNIAAGVAAVVLSAAYCS